ncbi:MAG: response regulator [Bacteroidaceae bacterium]|nr:response regulator [Bacteroidaceae bacterium]
MINIKNILTIVALTVNTVNALAQDAIIFDSKKGLSNSQIQTIREDSRCNIWITTRNGLNRYDGVKMNVYRHADDDKHSLLHDITTCVYEYDRNSLLVGTEAGIQMYDYDTDKFYNVPFVTEEGDTVAVHIIGLNKLKSGKVVACIGAYGAAEITKQKDGSFVAHRTMEYNSGNNRSPIQIFEDRNGRTWVVNTEGKLYEKRGKENVEMEGIVNAKNLCESSTGNLYLSSSTQGLWVFSKKDNAFRRVNDEALGYNTWSITPWNNGRIFICTDGYGLKVYDEETGSISQSPFLVNDFNLVNSNIKDVMCDQFGNVWIGIYWKGVMQKPIAQSPFEYVGRLSITKNTIGANSVTALEKADDNSLWVATDNCGLFKMEANGAKSIHFAPAEIDNMPSTINAICYDKRNGMIWMGSYAEGLKVMDEKSHKVATVNKNIHRVFDIKQDEKDGLWIATLGQGIYYYDHKKGTLINYSSTENNGHGTIGNVYISCLLSHDNTLYIGFSDGMEIYSISENHDLTLKSKVLQSVYVNDIKLNDGKIWTATNKGLYVVDNKTYKYTRYDVNNGLSNNVVNSIEFDGQSVWMGTDNGLACFDKKNKSFHNFFADDGLQDNEFGVRTSLKIGKNIYFGGISGLNYFTSESIRKYPANESFKLRIIDLYLASKSIHAGDKSGYYTVLDKEIDETKEVNLAYNDNHFSLELATPGIGYRHAVYEYSLDDKEWTIQSEQSNTIVFANLKPGTHRLKLRAKTYQAVSDIRELTIIIHHPWYSSPIAWCIYLLLLFLIGWVVYIQTSRMIHARRILAKHKKEEEMNEARIQFFMNISHEIRTPMTLIFAPLEKLMSSDKDEEHQRNYKLIHQNAKRIMRLINQMMDARKIEKGQYKLDFRPVEVVDFIQSICDVFSATAQNRNIDFAFQHPMDTLYAKIDPENIDKIVMNLLSNAFKFTPDSGKITLDLNTQDEKIVIMVTDNGSGIADEDKPKVFERFYSANQQNGYFGTGIGLNLAYLIVKMHNGNIDVEDNPEGKGTRFTVSIPLIDAKASTVENNAMPHTENTKVESVELPIERLKGLRHRNVLVVEDDEAIRKYLHSELSAVMNVTECCDGQEGWDYIIKNYEKIDLIISDRMMPNMDGLTLCQKVKQNFNTSHLPVILITALGTDTDRIAGISNGADAYITKPFNIDVLRTTAINILNTRLALQGKYTSERKTEEQIDKRDIESPDEHLLNRVIKVINENMDNPDLSVEDIADKVGISRVHFYRKMKELTGQSPRDFLKAIRLKEAARLLSSKRLDMTSVCATIGFKSLSNFSTCFKATYGMSPSEYAKSKGDEGSEE